MELYYFPGSCSLVIHVALRGVSVLHELAKVDLRQYRTISGDDYFQIDPKGTVPTLESEGNLLTEDAVIGQYLADRYAPTSVPVDETLGRSRLYEILNYLSSDYHRSSTPLLHLFPSDDSMVAQRPVLTKVAHLNNLLADGRSYILGDESIVADAHLFVLTR